MNTALLTHGFCRPSVSSVSSILLATALACAVFVGHSAAAEPNYDESAVRPFTLPDPLAGPDGVSAAQEPFHLQQSSLPVLPPPGAIVLVAADAAAAPPKFVSMAGGPIDWQVKDGSLVVNTTSVHANHIVSTATFRDADIHAEFVVAPEAKGNSGLYIHGHYEMQIFDSYGVEPPTEQDEGGLYRFSKPLVNAALPPGRWQVYDIRFIAPRRDATGAICRSPRRHGTGKR